MGHPHCRGANEFWSERSWRLFCGGDSFELLDVVDVVASHGFYDGSEGHGAAFRVGDGLGGSFGRGVADEDEVPLAHGDEGGEGLLGGDAGVVFGPAVLVEGLEDVVFFSEGLAEAEGEGDFAVGEMREDCGGSPFAGCWSDGEMFRADGVGEGFQRGGGLGEDLLDGAVVEEAGVRIEFGHVGSGLV